MPSNQTNNKKFTLFKKVPAPLLKWLKISFVLSIFVFLGLNLIKNANDLSKLKDQFTPSYFFLSIIVISVYLFIQSLIWNLIFKDLGCATRQRDISKLFFFSQLGKYIPGNIWVVLMRVERANNIGISKGQMFTSTIIEHLYALISGTIFFLVGRGGQYSYLSAVVIGLLLTASPGIFFSIVNRLLHLTNRSPINVNISYKRSFFYLTAYLFTWSVFALGIWLSAISFNILPLSMLFQLGGYYALSFIMGFLTPLSPGGLGVREGVFVFLAGSTIGIPFATVLAISVRLSFTIAELICIGLSFIFFKNNVEI